MLVSNQVSLKASEQVMVSSAAEGAAAPSPGWTNVVTSDGRTGAVPSTYLLPMPTNNNGGTVGGAPSGTIDDADDDGDAGSSSKAKESPPEAIPETVRIFHGTFSYSITRSLLIFISDVFFCLWPIKMDLSGPTHRF